MKILIVNSSKDHCANSLLPFFSKLQDTKDHTLEFQVADSNIQKFISENNFNCKKILFSPFCTRNSIASLLSLFLLPFFLIFYSFKFLVFKNFKKYKAIILFSTPEKILLTIPARLFKKKIIWISMPGKKREANYICKKLLRSMSRMAQIIAFTDSEKIGLQKAGYKKNNISVLYYGIQTKNHTHQENIFSEIAETSSQNNNKSKFFTIGTVTSLDDAKQVEILFAAVKKCVTIIPNIQFIVVGDGKMRKRLTWIAKKLEINNLVWFVGEQKHLRKWFINFDAMVSNSEKLNLDDINTIVEAMAAEISIIASFGAGLEYMIDDNVNGILTDTNNSDEIAAQIIRIHQNKHLRKQLRTCSRETIDKYFILDKMVDTFNNILKSGG